MSTSRWRVLCGTEGRYVSTDYQRTAPTTCPNDASHVIANVEIVDTRHAPSYQTIFFRDSSNNGYVLYDQLEMGVFHEIGTMLYNGTGLLTPTLRAVGSASGEGAAVLRVVNISTGTELGRLTFATDENSTNELTSTASWPTGDALLSLQLKVVNQAAVTLKSITLIL